ncbi:TetR/AcrR family transcriptional regulator [Lichenihabitans sp. PAMC28606]|uniref:TetR/AcrR family transcriptional regulator n=1 Tax=Lichenihabitans sp. PAMC28606 TaxID=2880932 RepID=UPI001D0BBDC9|nr:TetR/AcrR family transcriptional regulator [Lichenihabitans sp. PAMC28606]UDL96249.1 TetR/AcrR family transcriptional regulator [Lichenihabitans sp. PAMC28606]
MSTREKLVTEAALLLDAGGDAAVTLRAVAQAVGVSHNAPYKHFKDRSALLAAIAERDFGTLTTAFDQARSSEGQAIERLKQALAAFVLYGRDYPARYRLLFSNPEIGATGGTLEAAALMTFMAFARLVEDAQTARALPAISTRELAGLIYATAHGLIDLQAGGRMREQKGLTAVEQSVGLLLTLLRQER